MDTDPKELRAFDPSTGQWIKEPYLRPLPPPEQSSITPEVQQAFKDYLEWANLIGDNHYNVPEKLFFVSKTADRQTGDAYERQYYRVPLRDSFSQDDQSTMLRIRDEKAINVRFIHLRKYSELIKERDTWEGFEIWHVFPKGNESSDEVTNIRIRFHDRKLEIGYKAGEFWHARIEPENQEPEVGIFMEELNKIGGIIKSPNREVVLDKDNETIRLIREESGSIKDDVTLPLRIDFERAFNDLIPEQILEHPFAASPDLDNKWKEVDLKRDFGIDWQRPN